MMKEELQAAYKKLEEAEEQIKRMKKREIMEYKVQQILIAAGYITQEKINEAMDILQDLPDNN